MDNQGRVTQAEYHCALDRRHRRFDALVADNKRLCEKLDRIKLEAQAIADALVERGILDFADDVRMLTKI